MNRLVPPYLYTWRYYIVFVYYQYMNMYLYIFVRNYFAYTLGKGKYFQGEKLSAKMEQVYFVMTDSFIQKSNYIQTKADLRIHAYLNGVFEFFRIYIPALSKKLMIWSLYHLNVLPYSKYLFGYLPYTNNPFLHSCNIP